MEDKEKRNKRQYLWVKENYDVVKILLPKGRREQLKEQAEKEDCSVSALIDRMIQEKLAKGQNQS